MSQSANKPSYKQILAHPLDELEKLFPSKGNLANDKIRWRMGTFEKVPFTTIHHPELIEDLFSGRDVKLDLDPWDDPAEFKSKAFNLRPFSQRIRPRTLALEAIHKHQPSEFYERWLPWVESSLKKLYQQAKEEAQVAGLKAAPNVYQALRSVSLKLIARTLCVDFKGELLTEIEKALEGLDSTYAKLAYVGSRSKFSWLPGSDVKHASQSLRDLEATIRPKVREQIGGGEEKDDLLTRWVHTKGQDGRSLKEDQVIDEVVCFLVMAYTSLPKLLFGAIINITQKKQPDFFIALKKETTNIVKVITSIPLLEEGTPPPVTPHNEAGWKTLPLHNAVILEALRLYPPNWLAQYEVTQGTFPLGNAYDQDEKGPMVKTDEQIWVSPWGFHHDPDYYQQPNRFWPQRWGGNLEAELPMHMFAPFGFNGKPALSEIYCKEVAIRFLMVWFARYSAVDIPKEISWELSLCLRPSTSVSWLNKRDLAFR